MFLIRITLRFHDLRHTFVSRLLEQGVGLSVVGSIVGWSASTLAKMAKRYGHISADAQQAAVTRLVGFGRSEQATEGDPEVVVGQSATESETASIGLDDGFDTSRGTD